jgi:Chalcone isomerase-like
MIPAPSHRHDIVTQSILPATLAPPKPCLSRRFVLPALASLIAYPGLARPAVAASIAGVDVPESYHVDGHSLVLNGYGLRTLTFLRIKIYVAALYLPRKAYDPQAIMASAGPTVVVVHYLHSGTQEQVQSRYREGEQENCGDGSCDPSLRADFERLLSVVPPVEPGDTTDFVVTEKSLRISFNGRPLEEFGRGALGRIILAGFIGPHPPTQDLRASLLGLMTP